MADLPLYAAAVLAATVVWLVDRNDRLHDQLDTERAETAAAERDLRTACGSRRVHWRQLSPRCDGFTYANTGPTTTELHAWGHALDGLPWRTWDWGMPTMDTTPDPDAYLPKVAPPPNPVSEALSRAYRRISTDEVREVVFG